MRELQKCVTAAQAAVGLQGRDKDGVVLLYWFAWSFTGLFWRTGSSRPRCFPMTSRALSSANLDLTLSLAIPPKLCQFFSEPQTPACINTRVHKSVGVKQGFPSCCGCLLSRSGVVRYRLPPPAIMRLAL